MTKRVHGTCPYCDRPALPSGACRLHEELLAGEPDAIVAELERLAEDELEAPSDPPEPGDRPRRRRGSLRR